MKAIYNIGLGWAALLVVLTGSAVAQTSPDPSTVKVHFRLMAWDAAISDLNYAQGKKAVPVSMLANGRSTFYEYQGSEPLTFFREITGPDGTPATKVVATVPLSDFKERSLLMFFKSSTQPDGYRVQVIDDSDQTLPAGGFRFLNLSRFPLKVKCGDNGADVAPEGEETVDGTSAAGVQTMGMQIDAVTTTGIRHVYSNVLPYGKTTRSVIFVLQDPLTKAFDIKRLQEDIASLPKPSPTPRQHTT